MTDAPFTWMLRGCLLLLLALPASALLGQASGERNMILVTLDGVRPEDFFGGMDSIVSANDSLSGIYKIDRVRADFWRPTAEARRRAVMPFFWDSLAPRGMVFGNAARGSRVTITNGQGFSAPGYEEILTGQAQADVTSNDRIRYPHETVLEYVRRRLGLRQPKVAVFGSWENFREYSASREDAVFVNAGYDSLPDALTTPEMKRLAVLQTRALALWEGSRLDAFTGAMALEYLQHFQPRVMYVAMNDTDDLSHNRRYDRVLDALHSLDQFLWELWKTTESLPGYRGRTTLIVTTDHGRGKTPDDWTDHGAEVPGSENIWIAVIGPYTPDRGEVADVPELHQANIAGTLLACLGLDVREWNAAAAAAIPGACRAVR
ncbi:MAG: alkaline phosphatase family protein [Gemmatimonadota bacterium]